jgi:hypothetical protein
MSTDLLDILPKTGRPKRSPYPTLRKVQFQELTARHQEVLRRTALGEKQTDIAADLGITVVSVNQIIHSELGQAAIERHQEAADLDTVDILSDLKEIAPAAVQLHKEIVEGTVDASIALRAKVAGEVLDRVGFGRQMSFLANEQVLGVVVSLVGVVWTLFGVQDRIQKWLDKRVGERRAKAILALAAGAQQVYDSYVKDIKKGREDGKLTKQEISTARTRALMQASMLAESQGIDLATELGAEYLNVWLEQVLKSMRQQNSTDVGLSGLISIIKIDNKGK